MPSFCLALALELQGAPGLHAIACDTDGVDGAAEVAGAVISPDTLARARARGSTRPRRFSATMRTGFSARWRSGRAGPHADQCQ
ncbi:MAG: MOFRL family protein [Paracoccaceae bacterium]